MIVTLKFSYIFFNNFILSFLLPVLSGLIAFWFWLVRVRLEYPNDR